MFETCIVCREVPPAFGESYCEVCIRTLDNAAPSTVEFAPVPDVAQQKKIAAHGFPPQANTPLSGEEKRRDVTIREVDEDGDHSLTITPDTRRFRAAV